MVQASLFQALWPNANKVSQVVAAGVSRTSNKGAVRGITVAMPKSERTQPSKPDSGSDDAAGKTCGHPSWAESLVRRDPDGSRVVDCTKCGQKGILKERGE